MGVGSGGFYAAREAFKQAAAASSAPPDNTTSVVLFYAFATVLSIWGWPLAVLAAAVFGIVLYAPVRASIITFDARHQRAVTWTFASIYVVSVVVSALVIAGVGYLVSAGDFRELRRIAEDLVNLDGPVLGFAHLLGAATVTAGLPVTYLVWRIVKKRLWTTHGVRGVD